MGAADEKFRREQYEDGFVYIAQSQSMKLIKIGITKDPKNQRTGRLNRERYAGTSDWRLLYRGNFKCMGIVEHNVKERLFTYKTTRTFTRKGETRKRVAKEIFECDYSVAKQAIKSQASFALDEGEEMPWVRS